MTAEAGLDLQPRLCGHGVTLRPLHGEDFEALYAAAADPMIWAQHPDPERHRREHFRTAFFAPALQSGAALVAIEADSGALIGSSRYYDVDVAARSLAIGYSFLVRRCWGGRCNAVMKALMLDHALGWAETVWFHVGVDNTRSRRALEKIGARHSHSGMHEVNGSSSEHAWYRIDRADYPTPALQPYSERSEMTHGEP